MNVLCKINWHRFKGEESYITDGINKVLEECKIKQRVKALGCTRCRRVDVILYSKKNKRLPYGLGLERE